jgi:hypothetical protein
MQTIPVGCKLGGVKEGCAVGQAVSGRFRYSGGPGSSSTQVLWDLSEFLAANPEVLGSIPGASRFSE